MSDDIEQLEADKDKIIGVLNWLGGWGTRSMVAMGFGNKKRIDRFNAAIGALVEEGRVNVSLKLGLEKGRKPIVYEINEIPIPPKPGDVELATRTYGYCSSIDERIIDAVLRHGGEITRDRLAGTVGRNVPAKLIEEALERLKADEMLYVSTKRQPGQPGRPVTKIRFIRDGLKKMMKCQEQGKVHSQISDIRMSTYSVGWL